MNKGIYSGVSAMMVQQSALDATANNLANVDTMGFRARKPISKSFPEVMMERIDPDKISGEIPPWPWRSRPIGDVSMTQVLSETYMSTDSGSIQVTGGVLDLALENRDNFFVVTDGEGNQYYTRSGHFLLDQEGQVVTPDGHFLMGDGGPMTAGDASSFTFADDGQLLADGVAVGQVLLVSFETPTYLRQMGKNLLAETENSGAPQVVPNPAVVVGALEKSNVSVVEEMVRMIEAQRSYEAASKGVQTSDEMTGSLITSLGKP